MSDSLVIEVPVLEFGKEAVHNALQRLAIRLRSQGPHMMLMITPRTPTGREGGEPLTEVSTTWKGQYEDGMSGWTVPFR